MLDSLSIAGATLASLLQSCCTSQRPCVGLLFGRVSTAVTSRAQDTADALLVTHASCHITATCACVGTHAFYDSTGEVSEEQLAVLLSSCSSSSDAAAGPDNTTSSSSSRLLGWFSYRPGTPSIPSMLEAAVCQKLQAVLASSDDDSTSTPSQPQQQQQPLVFGLITSQPEHNGATISLQHRFFAFHRDSSWQYALQEAYRPSSTFSSFGGGTGSRGRAVQHPNLQPLELQVLNLGQQDMQKVAGGAAAAAAGGAGAGAAAFGGSSSVGGAAAAGAGAGMAGGQQGVRQLAALASALEESAGGAAVRDVCKQLAAAAAQVDAAGGQLSVVLDLYSSLLTDLQAAAAAVGAQQPQLAALQEENARLRQQVLLLQQQQEREEGQQQQQRQEEGLCGGGVLKLPAMQAHDLL